MANVGLLAPLAYVAVLVTALGIFSSVYRRRKAVEASSTSWFPPHTARDLYISLLQADPPAPESVLKSALLQRAMVDVRRILRMRESKVAAQQLLQKGSVGDDLWASLLKAEKELEAEVLDVVNEANTFANAWGPGIFATAGEMCIREKTAVEWNTLPEGPLPTPVRVPANGTPPPGSPQQPPQQTPMSPAAQAQAQAKLAQALAAIKAAASAQQQQQLPSPAAATPSSAEKTSQTPASPSPSAVSEGAPSTPAGTPSKSQKKKNKKK